MQPTKLALQKVDSTVLSTPLSVHPYPAVAPIYHPVQLKVGPRGIAGALSKSAADAEPANSNVAPTKPSTLLIRPSPSSMHANPDKRSLSSQQYRNIVDFA